MKRVTKRLLVISGAVAAILVCLLVLGVGLYLYITQPLQNGARLGAVYTVVTGHFGPVAIAAYLLELGDGTVGLVDAGQDREAAAIRTALTRLGKRDLDLRVIFLTHAHDDHAGGTVAFPNAEVYAIEPDADFIRRRREQVGVGAVMTKAVKDGDQLDSHGTHIKVYALPGHTPGSAAFLVHGVLFLGDAAQGMRAGTLGPNRVLSEDADRNDRSLKMLAERLKSRSSEIDYIAFGHSGPLVGLEPLLKWASFGNEIR
jgi:glyoxylase-like metal-dependent hydrolase (beta-lactamase superfamily II)